MPGIDFSIMQEQSGYYSIQNRRYLGNKYKLIDFIDSTVQDYCSDSESFFDVFSGTGVVAYHFMDRMQVITNDNLYSNYLAHLTFMSDEEIDEKLLAETIAHYNNLNANDIAENYMSATFKNTYFSKNDCKIIGHIRDDIETNFINKKINLREKAAFVTSLIYAMDKIANTCGHYDSYRKGVPFIKHLVLKMPDLSRKPIRDNLLFMQDSNELVKSEEFPFVDCVYCDPPYNSRNYCDLYHVLENVASWKKPTVTGVAKKMDRSSQKSRYCSRTAPVAFRELVNNLRCKYIILSYNNTGTKADDRSNARISDKDIIDIMSSKGDLKIVQQKHKAFTAGKSCNDSNVERLFVCKVK